MIYKMTAISWVASIMAESPEFGYPRPRGAPRIPTRHNAQAKSEQDGRSSASGALTILNFGAIDPSRSADWNAVIGHFGSEGADGR